MDYQMPAFIAKDLLIALVEREGLVIPKFDGEEESPDAITQAKILAEMYKIIFREINKLLQPPKSLIT